MKKLLVIMALVFTTSQASAGILLEPYVGYHMAKAEGSVEGDITGLGYGGRLGWTLPLVFFAFDYSMAGTEYESDSGGKADWDYTAMGLVVGASLPVIRVWAGYNFTAEMEQESGATFEGSGMKAGLGFKLPVLPISFNLEYILNEYDEIDGTSIDSVDQKGLFLSVSAPFNL